MWNWITSNWNIKYSWCIISDTFLYQDYLNFRRCQEIAKLWRNLDDRCRHRLNVTLKNLNTRHPGHPLYRKLDEIHSCKGDTVSLSFLPRYFLRGEIHEWNPFFVISGKEYIRHCQMYPIHILHSIYYFWMFNFWVMIFDSKQCWELRFWYNTDNL